MAARRASRTRQPATASGQLIWQAHERRRGETQALTELPDLPQEPPAPIEESLFELEHDEAAAPAIQESTCVYRGLHELEEPALGLYG